MAAISQQKALFVLLPLHVAIVFTSMLCAGQYVFDNMKSIAFTYPLLSVVTIFLFYKITGIQPSTRSLLKAIMFIVVAFPITAMLVTAFILLLTGHC